MLWKDQFLSVVKLFNNLIFYTSLATLQDSSTWHVWQKLILFGHITDLAEHRQMSEDYFNPWNIFMDKYVTDNRQLCTFLNKKPSKRVSY